MIRKTTLSILGLAATILLTACPDPVPEGEPDLTLDLEECHPALMFDASNGAWLETYNPDVNFLECQGIAFGHHADAVYGTWDGFTASISRDASKPASIYTDQFSAAAPVDAPYLVGYYASYLADNACTIALTSGDIFEPTGVKVCLNTVAFYAVQEGGDFNRPLNQNGDKLTLSIHGVKADGSEKQIDCTMASCSGGVTNVIDNWRWVDLRPLGRVKQIYFTMSSTDTGEWGDNTPEYFCLRSLTIKQ